MSLSLQELSDWQLAVKAAQREKTLAVAQAREAAKASVMEEVRASWERGERERVGEMERLREQVRRLEEETRTLRAGERLQQSRDREVSGMVRW